MGQKFLEGTSLFPPSDDLRAVNIDVRLNVTQQNPKHFIWQIVYKHSALQGDW
jgi:hypothetical protein